MKKILGCFVILFCILNFIFGGINVYLCMENSDMQSINYVFMAFFALSVIFTFICIKKYVKF